MTKEQALRLMQAYAEYATLLSSTQARHLAGMPERVTEDFSTEKTMRWLGFMQGALWASERFTLEELKEHSRHAAKSEVGADWELIRA